MDGQPILNTHEVDHPSCRDRWEDILIGGGFAFISDRQHARSFRLEHVSGSRSSRLWALSWIQDAWPKIEPPDSSWCLVDYLFEDSPATAWSAHVHALWRECILRDLQHCYFHRLTLSETRSVSVIGLAPSGECFSAARMAATERLSRSAPTLTVTPCGVQAPLHYAVDRVRRQTSPGHEPDAQVIDDVLKGLGCAGSLVETTFGFPLPIETLVGLLAQLPRGD